MLALIHYLTQLRLSLDFYVSDVLLNMDVKVVANGGKTNQDNLFFTRHFILYLLIPQGVSTIRLFINPAGLKPLGVHCPLM